MSVLEVEEVEEALHGVSADQELLGFDAHSAELADDLKELSLVLRVVLELRKQV